MNKLIVNLGHFWEFVTLCVTGYGTVFAFSEPERERERERSNQAVSPFWLVFFRKNFYIIDISIPENFHKGSFSDFLFVSPFKILLPMGKE
ncbi:MAG: hypothetical protein LBD59_02310 [Prevotellaceae bacterium]|jgi:hypothetical protein|nr:hypothetical protein [Prevotellaceae bacterium]